MLNFVRYNGTNGRSALYKDNGDLQVYASAFRIDEVIQEIRADHPGEKVTVRVTTSDDHLRGENMDGKLAKTLAEIGEYIAANPKPNIDVFIGPAKLGAVYVDGTLALEGDTDTVLQRAVEAAGGHIQHSDAYLCNGAFNFGAAPTLDDVATYRREQVAGHTAELRAQAAKLLREADELDSAASSTH